MRLRDKFIVGLLLCLFTNIAYTQDLTTFQHIRLSPQFAASLKAPAVRAANKSTSSTSNGQLTDQWRQHLAESLFDEEFATARANQVSARSSNKSTTPTDGQESLMFETIRSWLGERYESIGQEQVDQINGFNQQFNLGQSNFSGFTWQKPFGGFSIHVDRQLSPDLFDQSRWIVQDTMTINIEASTFLGKLAESGVVDMSSSQIAAFAGITFRRVYTSYHFAQSFWHGLIADYSRLFLPFIYFTPRGVLETPEGQIVKREDYWSIAAGGLIETPPLYYFSFSAGVMAQYSHTSATTVQALRAGEEAYQGEFLRVGQKTEKSLSAGVVASLQFDFFKIIKLTLLSAEVEWTGSDSREVQLSFNRLDRQDLLEHPQIAPEFARMVRSGTPKITWLDPYVTTLDETSSSGSNLRAQALLWGTMKKTNLEHVRIIKEGVVKTFFKNYNESLTLVQNFWSRLLSSVIFRIFNFKSGIKNDSTYIKTMNLEYEATHEQAANPNIMAVESTEQFSLTLAHSYEAARTDRWIDKSYRNSAESFLGAYTNLPADFRTMVRNEELRGPLYIQSKLLVGKEGLNYFHSMSEDNAFGIFAEICDSRRMGEWRKKSQRDKFMRRLQIGKELCVKELGKDYLGYMEVYRALNRIELARLKDILKRVFKKMGNFQPFYSLFGPDVFLNGSFQATSRAGMPFFTTFASGQFRGLGVIDNYKRNGGVATPASITTD